MGDAKAGRVRLSFNSPLRVEFRGATVTSDAGLLLPRELDEHLGLNTLIERHLTDPRTGCNRQFPLPDLLRQSIYTAWRATRTPTTLSGWPSIPPFGCWPRASGGRPASPSPRRRTGSRPRSWPRSATTRGSLASIRNWSSTRRHDHPPGARPSTSTAPRVRSMARRSRSFEMMRILDPQRVSG